MSKWSEAFGWNQGMTRRQFIYTSGASAAVLATHPSDIRAQIAHGSSVDRLRADFANPPIASQAWVYYWWLEGVATPEGITADLEEMKKQGISGVLIFDAGRTGLTALKGAKFMSEEWRANFRHTVREAARLEMEVGISLCTGWDAGGWWVERDDAIKVLVWREMRMKGPRTLTENELARVTELQTVGGPMTKEDPQDWYRELAVMALPASSNDVWTKGATQALDTKMVKGVRTWDIPAGDWTVMQFGYMLSAKHISLPSSDQLGWEIDPMSSRALEDHFRKTAGLLIQDAGEHAGKTFKYTHIDSWEIGQPTWTQEFVTEFKKHRGYDPLPYLPALADKTVENTDVTKRFMYDFRRVVADLVQKNYYGRLTELSHQHNMGTHSEAGGPFYLQYIDGLAAVGEDDIPMGEFWSTLPGIDIREGVSDPFFQSHTLANYVAHIGSVRQAATAAHIYGKKFCQAESFTGFDRDWTEDPYYLKAYGDRAFCCGLGRIVIHHYALVPDFGNAPGNQWEHVSIHFNRYLTWWDKCHAWLKYLGRCQHLLQQGSFVADILYYSGEAVPNFVLTDRKPVTGFDFDTTNAEALLTRATVVDRRITFSAGTEYRYLVIPDEASMEMSLPVLNKLRALVLAGATLIASRPRRVPGLLSYQERQKQLDGVADGMWGADASGEKKLGKGKVIWGRSVGDVIAAERVQPDVEIHGVRDELTFDWIHRRHGSIDIYFIANSSEEKLEHEISFRNTAEAPELWNAISGAIEKIPHVRQENGRTIVPMNFVEKESFFVVFNSDAKATVANEAREVFLKLSETATLKGPWEVYFDPAWGAPQRVTFEHLEDWTKHSDDGVRHYSGEATYQKTFSMAAMPKGRAFLDLGKVKNLAQVYLNGKDLGVMWTAPWRVEITNALKQGDNELKVEVVNLWPNRLIKDATLPKEKRLTKTNVRTYDSVMPKDIATRNNPIDEARKLSGKPAELLPSGLMGPVTIQTEI
jgi:hypothetical protein